MAITKKPKGILVAFAGIVVLVFGALFLKNPTAQEDAAPLVLRERVDRGITPEAQVVFDARFKELQDQQAVLAQSGERDISLLLKIGNYYYQIGELKLAADAYRDILTSHPSDGAALENLGQTLLEMGDYPGALESWQRALSAVPSETTLVRIVDLINDHNPNLRPRIGPILEEGIKNFGQKYDFLIRLGDWYAKQEDYSRAVSHYEVALQLNENGEARKILEDYRQKLREQEAQRLQQSAQ